MVPDGQGPYSIHIELIFSNGTTPNYDLKYIYGSLNGQGNTTSQISLGLGPVPTTPGWFRTQRDVQNDLAQTFRPTNFTALQFVRVGFGALGYSTQGETVWVDDLSLMFDRPTATFSSTLMPNLQVSFDASTSNPSSGASIKTYQWDFGDGKTATTTQPTITHTYSRSQNPTVTLNIADSRGHLASVTLLVSVSDTGSTQLGTYLLELVLVAAVAIGLFFGRKRLRRKKR